jgi:CubicO group peptidase (beta-lactamase class C family)
MPRRCLPLIPVITLFIISSAVFSLADNPRTPGALEASPVPENNDQNDATIADLKATIPILMRQARIPGLQIALVREGEIIWKGAFGVTNGESPKAVTSNTIFEAASLTKPLFAYVVLKMADKGLIDLDKPLLYLLSREEVEQLIGHSLDAEGFRLDWAKKITARHVLSHTAGTPHGDGGEIYPIFFEPGTDWKYSAQGYQLLQLAVEATEGKPLEEIVNAYALQPIGMEKSSMVWRDSYEKTMANGHGLYGDPVDVRKRSRATAAASLYTTAGDYARFVIAVLDGTGLKAETATKMIAPLIGPNDERNFGWGLGFGTQTDGQRTAFWQWGDYGIFRNYIIADPKRRSGVVYLANSFNGLSVCSSIVKKSIGQDALGCLELGYLQYDSPAYAFMWELKEKGPESAARLVELVKKYPNVFTDDRISGLAGIMENEEMYNEAIAIYRFIAARHPESGAATFDLARVSMLAGDLAEAKRQFKASLAAAKDAPDKKAVDWALGYIKAIEEPADLDHAYLQKIAGDYGPRHLQVVNGTLHYFREDANTADPRPLHAQTKEIFVLEGLTYFKLKVVFGDQGNPVKLVGMYESGQKDESPRDK